MEIHFIGTGAGVPSTNRNVSSIVLRFLQKHGGSWMFDCGEGTQQQILRSPVKLSKINKLFVTHLHGDHIFGIPGLIGSRSFQGGVTPLTIYGPKGIRAYIETALSVSGTHIKYPLTIEEIEEGLIVEEEDISVEAFQLDHGLLCFGYRIIEKDKPGKLNVQALKELGVKEGPIFRRIKNGETIVLECGKVINGNDFIGKSIKGRVIAIAGDTRVSNASYLLAKNADVLVHESTFSHQEEELAYSYFHSTTVQAAQIAREANVSTLLLTHISARYDGREDILLKEAQKVFKNTSIARDLWVYHIQYSSFDINFKNKNNKK